MSVNVREIIARGLYELETGDGLSHYLIRQILEKYDYLEDRDKAFIKRVMEGTIAGRITLDYVISKFTDKPVSSCKPMIRVILRMSAYQILFMDKVPARAVCDEAVKLTEKLSAKQLCAFVNAVLRKISEGGKDLLDLKDITDKTRYLSVKYSVPEWIVSMLSKEQADPEELIKGLTESRNATFRILRKEDEKPLTDEWSKKGYSFEKSRIIDRAYIMTDPGSLEKVPGFIEGKFLIQDESSMLAALATGISDGDSKLVIDTCAAPGGKSSFMASLMMPKGKVIASDISEAKRPLMEENFARLKLSNVEVCIHDAREFDESLREKADVVLVDAPCSGLGVMGKKSDLRYRISNEGMKEICAIQREIVRNAADYVKPGGILVYSTCTIHRAENEKVVKYILDNLPFEGDPLDKIIPRLYADGREPGFFLQLRPDTDGTDGFFIARFKKKDR